MFFKHLAISSHQSFCKKINSFPCFFRPLFHSVFLHLKITCFAPTCDFGPQFVSPWGPKCDHWAAIFAKKAPKGAVPQSGADLFQPTWARPAAQNARGYVFIDSGVDFRVILGSIFNQFGLDFGTILATIYEVSRVFLKLYWQRYSLKASACSMLILGIPCKLIGIP